MGPDPEDLVRVQGLYKHQGNETVARDIWFTVPRGRVFCLMGPAVEAKSALLKVLAGLERPDGGTVSISGIDVRENPADIHRRIGYMPREFGRHDKLTVSEYLDFYGACYGLHANTRRTLCRDLLELVDLTDVQSTSVDDLPSTHQKRLGFARCLLHDPDVLLLDEPFARTDANTRTEVAELVCSLADLGKAVILTEVDVSGLEGICNEVAYLEAGTVIRRVSPLEEVREAQGGTVLRLRIGSNHGVNLAREVLRTTSLCTNVRTGDESEILAVFHGNENDVPGLLRMLSVEGIPVTAVALSSPVNGRESDAEERLR